jgi:hypothetical protein
MAETQFEPSLQDRDGLLHLCRKALLDPDNRGRSAPAVVSALLTAFRSQLAAEGKPPAPELDVVFQGLALLAVVVGPCSSFAEFKEVLGIPALGTFESIVLLLDRLESAALRGRNQAMTDDELEHELITAGQVPQSQRYLHAAGEAGRRGWKLSPTGSRL